MKQTVKNAEDELRKRERKFSRVFHASPDWITLSTLKEGIYIDVNDTFLSSTGYSLKEVIGRSSTELGIWADSEKREEIVRKLLENGGVSNEDVLFTRVDVNQMEQVIMNLVLNARDAMPDGGKIVIRTSNIRCDENFTLYGYLKSGDYVRLTFNIFIPRIFPEQEQKPSYRQRIQ